MLGTLPLFIVGNTRVASAHFERLNPITGESATIASTATVADAVAAADAAQAAFAAYSERGPNDRRALLMRAAVALEARTAEFVSATMSETDATEGWARFNLMLAAGMMREAAALTTEISGEIIPSDKPGCLAMAVRQPAGVVLGIAPWNAPIILGVRAIAVPLACGNTVILKASEICPRTHFLIVEAFAEAGFTGGIVNLLTNAPKDAGDDAHAVEPANDTDYGLSAAVFTRDVARGLRIARQIRSGICHVNGPTVHDEAQMPFGGVNASGYGRFGGKAGIDAFTDLQWITIETLPGHFPI